jgi:hypothetical protein
LGEVKQGLLAACHLPAGGHSPEGPAGWMRGDGSPTVVLRSCLEKVIQLELF